MLDLTSCVPQVTQEHGKVTSVNLECVNNSHKSKCQFNRSLGNSLAGIYSVG